VNVATIAGLLRKRARLRTHDGWTRDEVLAYQGRRSVRAALERVGVRDVPVAVDLLDPIPRTALGKAPLIRRAALATAGH